VNVEPIAASVLVCLEERVSGGAQPLFDTSVYLNWSTTSASSAPIALVAYAVAQLPTELWSKVGDGVKG